MGRVTERRRVLRIRDGVVSTRPDTLVAEEPLEIRLDTSTATAPSATGRLVSAAMPPTIGGPSRNPL